MSRALAIVFAVGIATSEAACTPAQVAEAKSIEQLVLADLEAGKPVEAIESDVAVLLCGQPNASACVDVVVVLNDALTLLIDSGVIPANVLPRAKSMRGALPPRSQP